MQKATGDKRAKDTLELDTGVQKERDEKGSCDQQS